MPGLFHLVDGNPDGPPVLLLNGIAMSAVSWEPVAAGLRPHLRVIRCDLRGQLLTGGPAPADVGDHVPDVAAVLDTVGEGSVHVVGTSFGGAVGALLAARRPGRVRSLVSIASADGFTASMADEVARWRQACVDSLESDDRGHLSDVLEPVVYSRAYLESHREERAERRRQISKLPASWFEGLVGLLDSAESFELGGELGAIRCPTLVAAAGEDGFIPRERCRALADTIPDATFRVLEGAGHAVVVERPRELSDMIVEWIRRTRS